MEVYKDQVRQFSITIVQLEQNLREEQEKFIKLQTDFDNLNQNGIHLLHFSLENKFIYLQIFHHAYHQVLKQSFL
jgi:hypothetical protein